MTEAKRKATKILIPKKADNKNELNNYRSISQTPSLAKLFEITISVRLKI
jgi:hypothetical protein